MSLKTDRRHDPKLKSVKMALDQFNYSEHSFYIVAKKSKDDICLYLKICYFYIGDEPI